MLQFRIKLRLQLKVLISISTSISVTSTNKTRLHTQAQRLFRDRLADSESRTRFDGMLNAQLRSTWNHTANLTGVCIRVVFYRLLIPSPQMSLAGAGTHVNQLWKHIFYSTTYTREIGTGTPTCVRIFRARTCMHENP